jgi:hypothetical protein
MILKKDAVEYDSEEAATVLAEIPEGAIIPGRLPI